MDNKDSLINECLTISENCLYSAQTHFEMARRAGVSRRRFTLWPSIASSAAGVAIPLGVLLNNKAWVLLGIVPAVAGVVTAVAALFSPNDEVAHKVAGNLLTVLRHDSRALAETFASEMPLDHLNCKVRRLQDRYNTLVQSTEVTDPEAFEEARKIIRKGRFEQDPRPGNPNSDTGSA
ncbi:MAG: SLATT domain-containing protein [Candidatus Marsarchaeota archaeon]|nr:SLATT domain-containing protein [Candidatus Marsarchaeota archaeon]